MEIQSDHNEETSVTFELFIEFVRAFIPRITHMLLGVNSATLENRKSAIHSDKINVSPTDQHKQVSFSEYIDNLFAYICKLKWDFKLLVTNSTRFEFSAFDDLFVPVDESVKEFVCMMGTMLSNYLDIFKITEHPLQNSNTIVFSGCVFNSRLASMADGFEQSTKLKLLILMVSCIGILPLDSIGTEHAMYIFNKLKNDYTGYFLVPAETTIPIDKTTIIQLIQNSVNKQCN